MKQKNERILDTLYEYEQNIINKDACADAIDSYCQEREDKAVRDDRRKNINTAFEVAKATLEVQHEDAMKKAIEQARQEERQALLKELMEKMPPKLEIVEPLS